MQRNREAMSRSRDESRRRARELADRRRKVRARRHRWKRLRRQIGSGRWIIDDPIRVRPDPAKVRSFVESVLGFEPTPEDELPPHLTVGVDLALGGDSTSTVLVRHTESGRVRIEELASYLGIPLPTLDHD